MTPEQLQAIERIRKMLRDELSSLSREAQEAESAAFEVYLALGPRISVGKSPIHPADMLARKAPHSAGAYDAAKIVAAEILERDGCLPESMAGFIVRVLRDDIARPKSGGNTRGMTDLRNKILATAVLSLDQAGIHPTKAGDSKKPKKCGCEIVAEIYDNLLMHDELGNVVRPRGGEFSGSTMIDIWQKDPLILEFRDLPNRFLHEE